MVMAMAKTRTVRWGWLAAAIVVAIIATGVASISRGECFDAVDPAASYCASGPLLGAAGTWVMAVAAAAFVVYAVVRAFRRRPE